MSSEYKWMLERLMLKLGNWAKVAKAVGVTKATVSRWITGKSDIHDSNKVKIKSLLEASNDSRTEDTKG